MTNKKTTFEVEKKEIIIQHGCKTIRMGVEEAAKTKNDLEKAIENAKNYEPDLFDLVSDIKHVLPNLKFFYSSKKKKHNAKNGIADEEGQALNFIIKNKVHFEKFSNI